VLWRHHVIRSRFLVRRSYLPILFGGKSHPPTMIRKLTNFQNIQLVWLMRSTPRPTATPWSAEVMRSPASLLSPPPETPLLNHRHSGAFALGQAVAIGKLDFKQGHLYQAAVYAWNAFREDKTITTVKYDTKKGFYAVAA